MELSEVSDYPELVKYAGFEIVEEEMFGMYQGDWAFVVTDGTAVGLVVIGYGSCSYCDPLEHALEKYGYLSDGDESALLDLVDEVQRDVRWFDSISDIIKYARSEASSLNNWYASEKEFQSFITKLEAKNGT